MPMLPRFVELFGPKCLFSGWDGLADAVAALSNDSHREEIRQVVMGEALSSRELLALIEPVVTEMCRRLGYSPDTTRRLVEVHAAAFAGGEPSAQADTESVQPLYAVLDLLSKLGRGELVLLSVVADTLFGREPTPTAEQTARFVAAVKELYERGAPISVDLYAAALEKVCAAGG